ncbi:ankyrin, partial [Paxillus ammoniavirescens]
FKVLINAGCDPSTRNSDDKTALHIAANRGHTPAVEYMLSPGRVRLPLPADILLAAVGARWGNRAKIIKMLIDRGADVHAHTSDGGGILHVAMALPDFSVGGPLKTVKMLVNAGCDPSTCNSDGKMLHIAAAYGHISIAAKVLIEAGCDPATCNSDGKTPLHVAALGGHILVVEYML